MKQDGTGTGQNRDRTGWNGVGWAIRRERYFGIEHSIHGPSTHGIYYTKISNIMDIRTLIHRPSHLQFTSKI